MATSEAIANPIKLAVTDGTMMALVYGGPGKREWKSVPRPVVIDPGDAVIRITTTTICGTDLHIMKGDLPAVTVGRILGHEGVGIVEAVGPGVKTFRKGDRVLISCVSACGICDLCRKGMYSHCRTGGWILGNTIDGNQAEYVRTPHADTSLYHLPPGADEEALVMLSDILPTAFECGVLNGKVQPGDTVAIVGAGPFGLAALLTAQLFSPSAPTARPPSASWRSPAAPAWTWRSRRSAFQPPSTSARRFSRRAGGSRTSASMESRWRCTSRNSGIATSGSRLGSWTPPPRRC